MAITPKNTPYTNGAIIGYQNLLVSSSVTGDTSATSDLAILPNTFERWRPDNLAVTARFDLATSSTVNFVAIAAHNLSGQEISIEYSTTDGGALTVIESITPTSNEPFMITFDDIEAREIAIVATFAGDREIGVISAGEYLQMPYPIYGGHKPIDLSNQTTYQTNTSDSGQFLGRNVIRRGVSTSYNFKHLSEDFVYGDFSLFKSSAVENPFFIKWRPDRYETTAYGFTTKDISIKNMGGANSLMEASFTMRGHRDI